MGGTVIYNCFSEQGEEALPDNMFINECQKQGIEPVIFLDSCACLHAIKVVDYGRSATNVDLSKIIALKQYMENHPGAHVSPFFGLIELCSRDNALNHEKFRDFKYRLDFFRQIPLNEFRKFRYDFRRDFFIFTEMPQASPKILNGIQSILKPSYCALLKIRSIAQKGVSKNNAEKNVEEFYEWMIHDLDLARGLEYKLALNIFGGNTSFWKMIGLDAKRSDIKKKVLGTCWDFFHSRYTTRRFEVSKILQQNIHPYLLTSDGNLSNILKKLSLRIVKNGGDDFRSSSILNSDFSIPHLDDSFIDRQNRKIFDHFLDRATKERCFDEAKVDRLIQDLELENGILS